MPKRLIARLRPDSIREFRAAARERLADGLELAKVGRRTAAIYLWGYAAEISLKAWYFDTIHFHHDQPIRRVDLRSAAQRANMLGSAWPSPNQFHDLAAWADLVAAERIALGSPLPVIDASKLQGSARRLQSLWREILRYHSNVAYEYELVHVREIVLWMVAASHIR
jgi:hypothetical protein